MIKQLCNHGPACVCLENHVPSLFTTAGVTGGGTILLVVYNIIQIHIYNTYIIFVCLQYGQSCQKTKEEGFISAKSALIIFTKENNLKFCFTFRENTQLFTVFLFIDIFVNSSPLQRKNCLTMFCQNTILPTSQQLMP